MIFRAWFFSSYLMHSGFGLYKHMIFQILSLVSFRFAYYSYRAELYELLYYLYEFSNISNARVREKSCIELVSKMKMDRKMILY